MKAQEFLDRILEKILEGTSKNNKHRFRIEIVVVGPFTFTDWAGINLETKIIRIRERLILIAENEAEIAAVIAHEVGHILSLHLPTLFLKQVFADRKGIELLERTGYDTLCIIDVFRRIKKKKEKIRLAITYKNARRHSKKGQKKWILFAPEELEKVKEYLKDRE